MKLGRFIKRSSAIKVIGVGGGGIETVNYLYNQKITGVDFVVCDTNFNTMKKSPVSKKVKLGKDFSCGLNTKSLPEIGRNAAVKSIEHIKALLGYHTKIVFIVTCLGGATGIDASPIIAKLARDLDVLTIGIVTTPFWFEGEKRMLLAENGLEKFKQQVDCYLVISNHWLTQVSGELNIGAEFEDAYHIMAMAVKGIAGILGMPGHINIGFKDVRKGMKGKGAFIVGFGDSEGEHRALRAIESALSTPNFRAFEIEDASDILLNISTGDKEATIAEMTLIMDYLNANTKEGTNIAVSNFRDEALGEKLSATLVATGFPIPEKKKIKDIWSGSLPGDNWRLDIGRIGHSFSSGDEEGNYPACDADNFSEDRRTGWAWGKLYLRLIGIDPDNCNRDELNQ